MTRGEAERILKDFFNEDEMVNISQVQENDLDVVEFLIRLAQKAESNSRAKTYLERVPEKRAYGLRRAGCKEASLLLYRNKGKWEAKTHWFLQLMGVVPVLK